MDFSLLFDFQLIATHGGIGKASRASGRPKASLSRRLAELEEILEAEAAMPGLAELEAEAAENTERIRIRITDEIEFEG